MGITSKSLMALVLATGMALSACEQAGPLEPAPGEAAEMEELSALLSTASVDGPVASPDSEQDQRTGGRAGTDGRQRKTNVFHTLASQIPGFGGLYRVEPCTVALVLVDGSDPDRAATKVKEVIDPLVRRGCPDGIEVRVVEGTFTYVQLLRVRHAIRPLHEIRGVLGAKIDFEQNKVIVAVATREVLDEVRAALERLGVPAGAVGVVLKRRDRDA